LKISPVLTYCQVELKPFLSQLIRQIFI